MTFKAEITVGDIMTVVGLLVATLGLFLTFVQMRRANAQRRAEFLVGLLSQFNSDADMALIYYEIEYGRFHYTPGNPAFHQSPKEKQLDKLLLHFDTIAKLWQMGNVTLADLRIVEYWYLIVYQDKSVQEYLRYVEQWSAARLVKAKPFAAFQKLGSLMDQMEKKLHVL